MGQQIKKFRQELGLTQEDLAKKSGVAYTTLTKIESGNIKNPSTKAVSMIADALGVRIENLIDAATVEPKQIVRAFKGKSSISKILDDVYLTLKDSKGEVFISGIDERKFLEADKSAIEDHIERLSQQGITERLLAREGDSFFFAGQQSVYRWVPENLFNPTPIYVYGNKIAVIVWGPPQQAIIITNPALADAYRKQFLFIWERARIPPSKAFTEDERSRLETALLKRFGGRISSITDHDRKLYQDMLSKEVTNTYGNSFYYLCQAANGSGERKLGLKYFDGEMLATVGIFNRSSFGGGWHFHIIHPVGKFQPKKLLALVQAMLELSGNPVFVKKISKKQMDALLDIGFSSAEAYPWHTQAMEEDDTFPEQILDIEETLNQVEAPGKRSLKYTYTRFVSKFEKDVRIEDLSERNARDAVEVVDKFFDYLEIKELHISEPSDYNNIIFYPPLGKNGTDYFSQIIYIGNRPAGFLGMEPISKDSAGLYANIALHQEFPYLSEYIVVHACKILKKAGYKYLNLGGSETSGLFQFKDKFYPRVYNKMNWVVYKYR